MTLGELVEMHIALANSQPTAPVTKEPLSLNEIAALSAPVLDYVPIPKAKNIEPFYVQALNRKHRTPIPYGTSKKTRHAR